MYGTPSVFLTDEGEYKRNLYSESVIFLDAVYNKGGIVSVAAPCQERNVFILKPLSGNCLVIIIVPFV
jgi:hypothetical protein